MNRLIDIPFLDDFKDKMVNDVKVMTVRSKVYGTAGDIFEKFSHRFELLGVLKLPLGYIAKHFWRQEGVESEKIFIAVYDSLHPQVGFVEQALKYAHFFRREGSER